jgi:hypothetical protein
VGSDYSLGLAPSTAGALVACGLALGLLATLWWPEVLVPRSSPPPVETGPVVGSLDPGRGLPPAPQPMSVPGVGDLRAHLSERTAPVTAAGALDALLISWGHDAATTGAIDPNQFASAVRGISPLRVFVTRSDLDRVGRLDLPAILELETGVSNLRYAALLGLDPDGSAYLGAGDQVFALAPGELNSLWNGRVFYLWSNYESLPVLEAGMSGTAVRWLQARLTDLGYLRRGDASGEFDGYTVAAIRRFQSELGLDDTGEVGPETLMALYRSLDYGAPHLVGDLS